MIVVLAFLFLSCDYAVGIKGGENAEVVVPHMASLQVEGNHICGGVIISSKWILTSAFCTESYENDPSQISVVVGITYIMERGQSIEADKIVIHDQYYNVNNDISLVRLNGEIKFNKNVAAIKLPQDETKAGTEVVVSGFGSKERNGETERVLQMLNMTTLSLDKCNSLYKDRKRPFKKEQICAVGAKEEASVCNGDNGGPLYNGSKLVGIVSSTNSCGRKKPSIFTNIIYYKKWIEDNMK